MKKGLDPWVREHRTSVPPQGRSLVPWIWSCVAHCCWILSSRGTEHPDTFLKIGKKGGSESPDYKAVPEAQEAAPGGMAHSAAAAGGTQAQEGVKMDTGERRDQCDKHSPCSQMSAPSKSHPHQPPSSASRTRWTEDAAVGSLSLCHHKSWNQGQRSRRSSRSPEAFRGALRNWLWNADQCCQQSPERRASLPRWSPSYLLGLQPAHSHP